jgi:dTDP-4-amino-4,6-dideoxygalactose transaminase
LAKIPLARPVVDDEMLQAVNDALRNERLVLGESVFKFEEAFARYVGTRHAVSVSSGTDALQLVFLALNVRGKGVITSPLSFVATANSVVQAEGRPYFADASGTDYNLDPLAARAAWREGTAAVLPVHLFGHPAQMDELLELAQEKGAAVVEDACQAHGAIYRGSKAGSIGTAGCFSFYPTKNMTVGGDGGMVTTDDGDLAKSLAKLRDCGRVSRYVHDVVGYTSRLNNANAAFGLVQLKSLDSWNERRRAIAARYARRLSGTGVGLPPMPESDVLPVFHLFVIRSEMRDRLAERLAKKGIETGVHYPVPIHLQPVYVQMYGFRGGEYPVSERLSASLLSLPIFPSMTDEQVDIICEEIVEGVKEE